VEHSALPIGRTLAELDVPRSSFSRRTPGRCIAGTSSTSKRGSRGCSRSRRSAGSSGTGCPSRCATGSSSPYQDLRLALAQPEQSARQLAWLFTDQEGYFVSESSVFRLLKRFGLVESPAFQLVTAADRFVHPTRGVNELWQTDFTCFKVQGWGWYYLSTVLDDYSRYILAWKLSATMAATDVQDILEPALARARLDRVRVRHRPRLLSDNGPCYVSGELRRFLESRQIEHTRGAPYHPMTQGKNLP